MPETDGGDRTAVNGLSRGGCDEHLIARIDGSVKILEAHEYWQWMKAGPAPAYFGLFLMSSACFGTLRGKRQWGLK